MIPQTRSFLVLSPHPDDEVLGCGGTIMKLTRDGAQSSIIHITCGERLHGNASPVVAKQRMEEACRASEMLGCSVPAFLHMPDGEVAMYADPLHRRLQDVVHELRPDLIFAPSPIDHHQDHTATAVAALRLFNEVRSFRLAFYEVYSTIRFTHLIDIADVVEQKNDVIRTYRTSLYDRPETYARAILGLNAHRSLFVEQGTFFEAFWILEDPLDRAAVIDWLTYRFGL